MAIMKWEKPKAIIFQSYTNHERQDDPQRVLQAKMQSSGSAVVYLQ